MPLPAAGLRRLQHAAEPRAILVRTPNWLGDLIVATGFLAALRERFPRARLDLIVRAGFERLPLPRYGAVLPFDRGATSAGAFGRALRGADYSHLFVLPPSFSSAWMGWRSRIPWRVGYGGEGRSLLLKPALRPRHAPRSVHLLQEYLDLLAPWGDFRADRYPPRLDATPAWLAEHAPSAMTWRGHPVVLAPGAEYGPAKQWPAAHFGAVARALSGQGWDVVIVGLPKDRELGEEILGGVRSGFNLCGATTLSQLAALLGTAALLVSNDSGAMHLAAALGVQQVAIFGSTNPAWTGPLNPRGRVAYRQEPCSPCYARTCRFGHTRCLTELAPEGVIEEAERLLLSAPKGDRPAGQAVGPGGHGLPSGGGKLTALKGDSPAEE
jgi:heptosyltransferase-2